MEALQQARWLYNKCHDNKVTLPEMDKYQLSKDIQRFVYIALREIASASYLFENDLILDVLKVAFRDRAAMDCGDIIMPVTRAFQSLEKYFLLLIDQPWKPEFKKLKMYGGFYRTKIKSVLHQSENIFRVAGYDMEKGNMIMTYSKPISKEVLLALSFDCHMAMEICKNVDERYGKIKGLGKSMSDAVSEILHEAKSPSHKIPVQSVQVDPFPPPLVPKREPLVNGLQEHNLMANHSRVMPPPPLAMHGQCLASQMYINARTIPPFAPSSDPKVPCLLASTDDNMPYIDQPDQEILPELPEGTCDDHIRESLKLVERQKSSKHAGQHSSEPTSRDLQDYEDWSWMHSAGQHQNVLTLPVGSHPLSALTYPPAYGPSKGLGNYFSPNTASIDEGIENDFSTMSKPSSQFRSVSHHNYHHHHHHQTPQVSRLPMSFQTSLNDPGYRTGPSSNVAAPPRSINLDHAAHVGYPPQQPQQPQPKAKDLNLQQQHAVSRAHKANSMPPPLPSRALKPNYQSADPPPLYEDVIDGMNSDASNGGGGGGDSTFYQYAVRPRLSAPSNGVQPAWKTVLLPTDPPNEDASSPFLQSQTMEPILRRDRLHSGNRSSSLKNGDQKSPLALVAAQSRVARSMDLTYSQWECRSCTSMNVASNTICSICNKSRYAGVEDNFPLIGQSMKACSQCTFENMSSETHCTVCSAKLPNLHSYV